MKIIIPGVIPPSPNELRRKYRNPHAYARLRQSWEQSIFILTKNEDRKTLRNAAPNNRMVVKMVFYHSRQFDPDNLAGCQKPILDALKRLGYIHDDRAEWLRLEPPRWSPAPRNQSKTEIDIDIDEATLQNSADTQFSV